MCCANISHAFACGGCTCFGVSLCQSPQATRACMALHGAVHAPGAAMACSMAWAYTWNLTCTALVMQSQHERRWHRCGGGYPPAIYALVGLVYRHPQPLQFPGMYVCMHEVLAFIPITSAKFEGVMTQPRLHVFFKSSKY